MPVHISAKGVFCHLHSLREALNWEGGMILLQLAFSSGKSAGTELSLRSSQ